MASNLYGILGVDRNATQEQIRKAYKKQALATHPDRFSSKSAEEKALAEAQFRDVNNAYEVLNDPSNRRLYDLHGVWPPPEEFDSLPSRRERRHTTDYRHYHYSPHDPFYFPRHSDAFHGMPRNRPGPGHGAMPPRHHADPFVVFNSVFGDFDWQFKEAFAPFSHAHSFPNDPWMSMPHDLPGGFIPAIPDMFHHPAPRGFAGGSGGRPFMRQETRVTTTINGVTESTWTRTDSDGNEHVTHTYPDGREKYTVNGMEQLQFPESEPFIPPAPQAMSNGYAPPPIMNGTSQQRPPQTRHHSWEHDGLYNSAAVHPERDRWNHGQEPKRHWWHATRR